MPIRKTAAPPKRNPQQQVAEVLAWLEQKSTPRDRGNLGRLSIKANKALGVSLANLQSPREAPSTQR
jgi:hypothetical protein